MPQAFQIVHYIVAERSSLCYTIHMTKTDPVGIRLEPEERAALERAAAADDRPMSALARKILVEWLRKHGHLKGAKR